MVNFNELRIGNYILYKGSIRKISMINNEDGLSGNPSINYEFNEGSNVPCDSEQLQPIAITDAVLQNLGFVLHHYLGFWQKITMVSGKRSEMDINKDYSIIDFMRRPVVKNVSTLHQLQNIYYALTASELVEEEKQNLIFGARRIYPETSSL
jgi:hypothetical protein